MNQAHLDFTAPAAFDPKASCVAPSSHLEARETSALAAIENAQLGRKAKQNAIILKMIREAGAAGISDKELHRATGIPRASICARRGYDLKTLIEPADGRYIDPISNRSFTRWKLRSVL